MTSPGDGVDPDALRRFGAEVDFGKTAADYATHRAGFPPQFFELLSARGWAQVGQQAVDLGCGTGTVARGLTRLGLSVTGVDPAGPLLRQAAQLDAAEGVSANYVEGTAEATGLDPCRADLVTAGQCWHWFDRASATVEVARLLRPGGRVIIAHFDWVPLPGNVVAETEALILRFNPDWAGAAGTGLYPAWLRDLGAGGFTALETLSFDIAQPYSHAAWRGRIRASAGIAASLDAGAVTQFDAALADMLRRYFAQDPLDVPHRVWLVTGVMADGQAHLGGSSR